jgi:hypothetical protein
MITLIARAVIGVAIIALILASNRHIFRRIPSGPQVSQMECAYYVIGVASVGLAWYFQALYVSQYSSGWENPVWGKGGWTEYIKLMFANPAASAVSQGFLIANLLLLPLYTIVDGYRRGVRRPWLYFVLSWFIPFAFVWAFYLATVDRHRRLVACNAFDLTGESAAERRPRKRFEMN